MVRFIKIFMKFNITVILAVVLFSCENPISVINEMANDDTLSCIMADSVVFYRSDSGLIQMELRTPRMVRFENEDEIMEFPLGFNMVMFDKNKQKITEFSADYGKNYGRIGLIEAIGNVKVENTDNQQTMYSDKLYWYQKEKMIHTRSHVRIISPDKEIEGDSLVAKEDFSEYTMYSGSALLDVEDE